LKKKSCKSNKQKKIPHSTSLRAGPFGDDNKERQRQKQKQIPIRLRSGQALRNDKQNDQVTARAKATASGGSILHTQNINYPNCGNG
jgi:hypothetical protein